MKTNFWKTSILAWEHSRYDSLFSKFLYSSLHRRQEKLIALLESLPDHTRVLELGCGSGRLFRRLANKERLNYTGVDFSKVGIRQAKTHHQNDPNALWIKKSVQDLQGLEADYIVSIGLMDWISDEDFEKFLAHNQGTYHFHSFSLKENSFKARIHRLFTSLIRLQKNAFYSPHIFSIEQIKRRLQRFSNATVYRDPLLSFCAFVHNLPNTDCLHGKNVKTYFQKKKNVQNVFEFIFKKIEFNLFKKLDIPISEKRVLEIGSGTGQYSEQILKQQPKQLVAIDPFVKTNQFVQSENFHFQSKLRDEDRNFDVALCFGVLEFANSPFQLIEETLKALKPDAQLYLVFPQVNSWAFIFYRYYHLLKNNIILNKINPTAVIQFIQQVSPTHQVQIQKFGLLNLLVRTNRGPNDLR